VRGSYGQYCPIARGAEVFAERWTPVIVRNILLGCETFTEIERGAPGIPRSLLAQRLSSLERRGLLERITSGKSSVRYVPTQAGQDLWSVCEALGVWGARWLELAPEHLDPYVALWSMCKHLATERLPERRVVVRFDFTGAPAGRARFWLLLEHRHGEVCAKPPGEEDLRVHADAERFIRWHMGRLSWKAACADDAIHIDGPRALAGAFPTWNQRSPFAGVQAQRRG
jgi:DNA-binding HxlR family transcriptional regulator